MIRSCVVKIGISLSIAAISPILGIGQSITGLDSSVTGYHVTSTTKIPGQGGWDQIGIDAEARRVYVAHGDQVDVLDADKGNIVGHIVDTPEVGAIAIASDLKKGFTSNGGDASVTMFNTSTLETIKKIKVNSPDLILYDPFTKRVFPLAENTSVIDALTGNIVGEVNLGGHTEGAVTDSRGHAYINLGNKGAVAVLDTKALTVLNTYSIPGCSSPSSLAFDLASNRLFVGCIQGLKVLDPSDGKITASKLMCSGADASAFDPDTKLIFESCAEGVISVIHEIYPNVYEYVDTVKTKLWARSMALDTKTKKIFLPTAEYETIPSDDPSKPLQRRQIPGSFQVLTVSR